MDMWLLQLQRSQSRDKPIRCEGRDRAEAYLASVAREGWPHLIDPHRSKDVFQLLLACVLQGDIELLLHIFQHSARHANATGLGNRLQTCCDVHAVSKNVTTVDHDIPDVDADAKLDPPLFGHVGIALSHAALDINGATQRVHNTAELSQQPIAGILDYPPTVLSDFGFDVGAQMVLKPGVRPLFVQACQPTVTSHIGRQDGCKPSLCPLAGQRFPPRWVEAVYCEFCRTGKRPYA